VAVLGHPEKQCTFRPPYLISPTHWHQLGLNLANLEATAIFLQLVHFDVVVQQQAFHFAR